MNAADAGCTTRLNKTHFTERVVRYRWHPWYGRAVVVFVAVKKGNDRVIRCALEPSHTARPLEIPEWMFEEASCLSCVLSTSPVVRWEALRQLSELLIATGRFGKGIVVQAGHLDCANPGGTDAVRASPTGDRSAQSVSSHSGHATMGGITAGSAAEDVIPDGTTAAAVSPSASAQSARSGGAR